jgi:hypothetical protein
MWSERGRRHARRDTRACCGCSGVGLAIAEARGGRIHPESDPGNGAAVWIDLRSVPGLSRAGVNSPAGDARPRVLVAAARIDDERLPLVRAHDNTNDGVRSPESTRFPEIFAANPISCSFVSP